MEEGQQVTEDRACVIDHKVALLLQLWTKSIVVIDARKIYPKAHFIIYGVLSVLNLKYCPLSEHNHSTSH